VGSFPPKRARRPVEHELILIQINDSGEGEIAALAE
jgi:hypothetical protein